MKTFIEPQNHVKTELDEYLHRMFPNCFAETNVHPQPVWITYERQNGVVTASVTLRWQLKPDFKEGQHLASFTYQEKRGAGGREYHWYCTSGWPDY